MFSPDRTQIAFSSDRPVAGSPPGTASGSYNVWVLTLATGQLTEITHEAVLSNAYYPTWTPDGSHITYVENSHSIEFGLGRRAGFSRDALHERCDDTVLPDDRRTVRTSRTRGSSRRVRRGPTSVNQGPLTQLFVNGQAVSGDEDVFAFPAPWLSDDTLVYAANGRSCRDHDGDGDGMSRSQPRCRSRALRIR